MNLEESVLPNGLRVISYDMAGSAAAVGAYVDIGTRHETKENNGVAHFLEHMSFKATENRTAFDIASETENLGAYTNAMTGKAFTAYFVKGLAEHMPTATDILGDVMTNSVYDAADIELESGVIMQEINQYKDDPFSTMYELLEITAYPDQPVGRPTLGSEAFVQNATRDDFRSFIDTYYSAETMVLFAAGGVDHAAIVEAATKSFAKIPASTDRPAIVAASYVGGLGIDRTKDFAQVSIGIMFPSVPIIDSSVYAHRLLVHAFGTGMSSPLFQEVREKRGLVYHTSCHSDFEIDHGNIAIFGGMTPENLDEFIKVSCSELAKFRDTIKSIDLTRAKNSLLVNLSFTAESAQAMLGYMSGSLFSHGYIKDFEEVRNAIKKVTIDDLKAAASRILSSKPTIALVGPVPEADYMDMVKSAIGG